MKADFADILHDKIAAAFKRALNYGEVGTASDLHELIEMETLKAKIKAVACIMRRKGGRGKHWLESAFENKSKQEEIMFKINMKAKVKDSITGFTGIVTARAEYITGCRQYLVSAKVQKNKMGEALWFDEDRLINSATKNPGGPQANEAPTK